MIKSGGILLFAYHSILHPPQQGVCRSFMWIVELLTKPSPIQAVIILSAVCALGLSLAKFRVKGISLGITFVFFAGILAGAVGLRLDPQMQAYAESFGLILFVYTLGLQVGPGFVTTFRHGGTWLNILSLGVVALGTVIAVAIAMMGWLPFSDLMGVLCGATTNSPALGAAQQTLKQLGQPSAVAALSFAVTYPIGMIGVIIVLVIMRGWLQRHDKGEDDSHDEEAFITAYCLKNPALFGKDIYYVVHHSEHAKFVISRIWREGKVILPNAQTVLEEGDRLLIITLKSQVNVLTTLFGEHEEQDWNKDNIDWNAIDAQLISRHVLITRPGINGKRLRDLNLRLLYGVTVSRVKRTDLKLLATPDLMLRVGDRVTVVGNEEGIEKVVALLGNEVKSLEEPNMVTIFLGIVLGLLLGSVPIHFGLSYPISLGLAGGPIIMGIIIGAYGPRLHMVAYTTQSANLMLRSLGLSMYLACLGLDAGGDFLATVMQPAALKWIGFAALLTALPMAIVAVVAVVYRRKSFATTAGMLCGAMANPIALGYVNDTVEGDQASLAYAAVYPLAMFLRVIIAQIIVMLWFG